MPKRAPQGMLPRIVLPPRDSWLAKSTPDSRKSPHKHLFSPRVSVLRTSIGAKNRCLWDSSMSGRPNHPECLNGVSRHRDLRSAATKDHARCSVVHTTTFL